MHTRTGNYPIYFRRGWSDWQKRSLSPLAAWAKQIGYEGIDLGALASQDVGTLQAAGLSLGTADLLQFDQIATPDMAKRAEILAINLAYLKNAAAAGATKFFTIIGGEPEVSRSDNYRGAVEAFTPIAAAAADVGGRLAVEGYPGNAPHYALLATTPETVRALIRDIPRGFGLNYDPSHLIRLGVDPVRFLREFLPHVVHVHAKDTQLFPEAVYEFGLYQPAAFASPHRFGQHVWRYTLPGHGVAPWTTILQVLHDGGYRGAISVELEDEHFNGTEAGEQAGLTHSLQFLQGS